MDDDKASGHYKPPIFSGLRPDWTKWIISFTIWLAYHANECSDMLEDLDPKPMPTPSAAGASGAPPPSPSYAATLAGAANPATPPPTPASTATGDPYPELLAAWTKRNRKLFGALGTAMPGWLATSLYTSKRGDGVGALAYRQAALRLCRRQRQRPRVMVFRCISGKKAPQGSGVLGALPPVSSFPRQVRQQPEKKITMKSGLA